MKQYPRSEIQIIVQILESGENDQFTCMELSCAVNSIYLSLLNAGIGLESGFLSSFSACVGDEDVILRPNKDELNNSKSHNVSVFSIVEGKCDELIYSDSLGKTSEQELFNILHLTSNDIEKINVKIQETIQDTLINDFIWKF